MKLEIVTQPASLPVTLDEFKAHIWTLYEDTTDALLTNLLTGAVIHVEEHLNRKLVTQTWRLYLDAWPDGDPDYRIHLPFGRCSSVTSVKWKNESGTETTLTSGTDYITSLVGADPYVEPVDSAWPTDSLYQVNPINVVFKAGFGAASAVPQDLKVAICQLAAHSYEHREASITGTIISTFTWYDRIVNKYKLRNA